MQLADSLSNNRFMESSQLITGASGGMMGASFYREMILRKKQGASGTPQSWNLLFDIGKDLLNPITFSITVSDLFFNLQRFKVGNTSHPKDRAYAFEKQFNENTLKVFAGKTLSDYHSPEWTATVPMTVITPTLVEDGRRLVISAQAVSYLTAHQPDSTFGFHETIDAVEFRSLFKDQSADSVRYSSLLRMNATFPYILPAVSLPTNPETKVMDAGMRDVTGLKTSLIFVHVFRDWIAKNTSGVIFVDIRDSNKSRPLEKKEREGFLGNIVTPLGNIYKNLLTIQDYNQDEAYEYAKSWANFPFDHVLFELPTREQEISLSFHLTTKEKMRVINATSVPRNKESMDQLQLLLQENQPR